MDYLLNAIDISKSIKELYMTYGNENYDGELISQTSHMVQCAMLAERDGAGLELILGAFLHDIGHLLKQENEDEIMGEFGAVNHETLGAVYLERKGFSERIVAIVAHHVAAKRFLVATDKTYAEKLSFASAKTLEWQGGAMNKTEIELFKKHPFFEEIIRVRLWDEKAKLMNITLLPLDYYIQLIKDLLSNKK
jgi:phosphonate degradation associated HDIG domain protein